MHRSTTNERIFILLLTTIILVVITVCSCTFFRDTILITQRKENPLSDLWQLRMLDAVNDSPSPLTNTMIPLRNGQNGLLPAPVFLDQHPNAIRCQTVEERIQSTAERDEAWWDPNHGRIWARRTISDPTVWMSLHNQSVDNLRWITIYERGRYYEYDVIERFNTILGPKLKEQQQNDSAVSTLHHHHTQRADCLVLDVGANIGYYTMVSAAHGCNVISFELVPFNMLRYCQAMALNNFHNQVALYQMGVTNVEAEMNVRVNLKNPGESSLSGEVTGEGGRGPAATASADLNVKTVTLDAFAKQQGWLIDDDDDHKRKNQNSNIIKLLKIDVEGGEFDVVEGGQDFFKAGLAENILLELRFGGHLYEPAVKMMTTLFAGGYMARDAGRVRQQQFAQNPRTGNSTYDAIAFLQRLREVTNVKRQEDLWFYQPKEGSSNY